MKYRFIIILVLVACIPIVLGYALPQVYETNPDCENWTEVVELAKQDYPYLVNDAVRIAEKHCS